MENEKFYDHISAYFTDFEVGRDEDKVAYFIADFVEELQFSFGQEK